MTSPVVCCFAVHVTTCPSRKGHRGTFVLSHASALRSLHGGSHLSPLDASCFPPSAAVLVLLCPWWPSPLHKSRQLLMKHQRGYQRCRDERQLGDPMQSRRARCVPQIERTCTWKTRLWVLLRQGRCIRVGNDACIQVRDCPPCLSRNKSSSRTWQTVIGGCTAWPWPCSSRGDE